MFGGGGGGCVYGKEFHVSMHNEPCVSGYV